MSSDIPGDRPSDFTQPGPAGRAGYGAAPTARPRRNGMGTAGLVIGVVALVLAGLILFAPLGAFLGLVALVLGIVGLIRANRGQADNRGQAVAGLVTGALALVIGLFFVVSIGAFFATNVNDFRQFGRCLDGARGDQARQACAERLERSLDR
jgi:membrane-bound ClpP family serine protease